MPEEWKKQPIVYATWAEGADIAISINQQIIRPLTPVIEKYAKENGLNIKVNKDNCGISASHNKKKLVDISSLCCPAGEIDRLPDVKFYTIAISPLRILVNKDNPIEDVTLEQARDMFAGKISNWSNLKLPDGKDGPDIFVKPIGRLHCKSRPGHWKHILSDEEMFSMELNEVSSIVEMIYTVAKNPGAIGYEVDWMVKQNEFDDKVKSLKINGYDPDNVSHMLSKKYPLYRSYNLTIWENNENENPKAKKLVEYILKNIGSLDSKYNLIGSKLLKENGWKFLGEELVGEPGQN
jgi:ABC-type phosphate transport system substrate-binding protein